VAARTRALLIAAPAVLPVVLVLGGSLIVALLQSVGLLPFIGEPDFTTAAWNADGELLQSVGISVYIAAASTVLAVVVGFLIAAYVLTSGISGRVLAGLSAASVPIPHLVASGAMGLLLSDAGFLTRLFGMPAGFPQLVSSSWWGAVILEFGWKESAFVALILLGSMARTAGELCDAAATLGASALRRMVHVLLPLALPSLAVSALVVFVYTLGSYEAPWLLGPVAPEPLPVRAVRLFGSIDLAARPEAMATALASVVAGLLAISAGVIALRRMKRWR
jgi:putative spermidine/putrescine transport system permease protein